MNTEAEVPRFPHLSEKSDYFQESFLPWYPLVSERKTWKVSLATVDYEEGAGGMSEQGDLLYINAGLNLGSLLSETAPDCGADPDQPLPAGVEQKAKLSPKLRAAVGQRDPTGYD
ncbi:hypothetical protein STEG23_003744, partial [Scotinomys teguina]